MEKVFNWRDSEIHFVEYGTGKETLICFHGYGQNSGVFDVFKSSLSTRYRVVSIDLPYQGKTVWRNKIVRNSKELADLVSSFLHFINAPDKLSLMAYSIGGNYALGLAASMPERINAIWLLAADGLVAKPGFDFITKTRLGRLLFKSFVLYPSWVFYSLKLAGVFGIASKRVIAFYYSTIETRLKREALFKRWTSTSRIAIHPTKAIKVVNSNSIEVFLIFGKKDSVIPYQNAVRFDEKIEKSKLVLLDSGHQILVEATNQVLEELLGT